jgi:hypothetical protein
MEKRPRSARSLVTTGRESRGVVVVVVVVLLVGVVVVVCVGDGVQELQAGQEPKAPEGMQAGKRVFLGPGVAVRACNPRWRSGGLWSEAVLGKNLETLSEK